VAKVVIACSVVHPMPSPFPHQQLAGQDLFSSLASWVVKGKGSMAKDYSSFHWPPNLLFFSLL